MAKQPATVITEFVLDRLPSEPMQKRAEVYRALSTIVAPAEQKSLTALADECEAIERHHQQLALDFQRRALG